MKLSQNKIDDTLFCPMWTGTKPPKGKTLNLCALILLWDKVNTNYRDYINSVYKYLALLAAKYIN